MGSSSQPASICIILSFLEVIQYLIFKFLIILLSNSSRSNFQHQFPLNLLKPRPHTLISKTVPFGPSGKLKRRAKSVVPRMWYLSRYSKTQNPSIPIPLLKKIKIIVAVVEVGPVFLARQSAKRLAGHKYDSPYRYLHYDEMRSSSSSHPIKSGPRITPNSDYCVVACWLVSSSRILSLRL